MNKIPLITILGPTAVGKTRFAAELAYMVGGEIISADSRQVFRGMDIGTGKDLADYVVNGLKIPAHMVNVAEAGTEFSVFSFKNGFAEAYQAITSKGHQAIMCGGTGMYLEAILLNYQLPIITENGNRKEALNHLSEEKLIELLRSLKPLHNTTDTVNRQRLVKAIEIEYEKRNNAAVVALPDFSQTPVIGLRYERQTVRERITQRLLQRLNEGMIEEVQQLLAKGVSPVQLKLYGLEYKYITQFLLNELKYDEMVRLLNTAIHQFAKRQITWYRRMERKGIVIHWLDGENGLEFNLNKALEIINR